MKIKLAMDFDQVKEYISQQPASSKIYLGADSERYCKNDVWLADFTLAVVIHHEGCHGCKVFGEVHTERDFDQKKSRPVVRLMNEVYKVAELYLKLADVLVDRDVEIHLDINPEEQHASSAVVQQAIGYIKGVCQKTPRIKPDAFAASVAADRLKELLVMQNI
jgi:predicted RNase H-related nuclease YkuK (DUF458 family)